MHASHKRQIEEGIEQSLVMAGIPRSYHFRQLSTFQHRHAPALLEWVQGEARLDSRGKVFVGSAVMEDLCIVTARNLHLSGQGVRCLTLLRFVERLESYDDLEDYLADAKTLVLRQFGSRHADGQEVFSRRELRKVEDYLFDWFTGGKRVMMHADFHLDQHRWWSPALLQRVAEINDTLEDRT